MRTEESIFINAPVDRVFRTVTSPGTWTRCVPGLVDVTGTPEEGVAPGTTFGFDFRVDGRVVHGTGHVNQVVPNAKFSLSLTGPFALKEIYTFTPSRGGTDLSVQVDGDLPPDIAGPHDGGILESVRDLCETDALPEGRRAAEGDLVRIVYSCRLDDGTVFDYGENRDPLEFTIGEGETIPALERGVVGMREGERRDLRIPASAVTGITLEEISKRLHVREIPAEITGVVRGLDIGPGAEGDIAEVLVPGIAGAKFSLAGRDLTFQVLLVEIAEKSG